MTHRHRHRRTFHANRWLPGTREPYLERVSAASDPALATRTVQRWLDALDD